MCGTRDFLEDSRLIRKGHGNLLLLAWTAGLSTRVDTWGLPPLERMTKLFFEMNASAINTRVANEGRVPDVLVHSVRYPAAIDRLVARGPN